MTAVAPISAMQTRRTYLPREFMRALSALTVSVTGDVRPAPPRRMH